MQLSSHSHPLLPHVFSRLACHVVDSTARRHDFSFSHILPVLGWHQFHTRSHPISPIVVGGNATSHLGHVFVINPHQSHFHYGFRLVSSSSHDSPSQRLEVAAF